MQQLSNWRVLPVVLICAGIVFASSDQICGQDTSPNPAISEMPLDAEQLAAYRAVLVSWFQSEKFSVNLSEVTSTSSSPDSSEPTQCGKGLKLEPASSAVHRFEQRDVSQLGLGAHIQLVNPDAYARHVREHDPRSAIRDGKAVNDAVIDGFAHSLFTLGEIRFNREHTIAVVSFSFRCGSLCGNGNTMLLAKKNGVWKQKKQCQDWVS